MRTYFILFLLVLHIIPIWACRIIPTPPIIIDRPTPKIEPIIVRTHTVDINVQDGVTTTVLESVFYNPNPQQLEGTYLFPLPAGASVSQFSMWIDGKEMQGELLDATKARELYIEIVRRMIDPGLLEFVGRDTFQMRIFPIPGRGEKRVKLSYQQVLKEEDDLMTYVYPLTTVGNGREDTLGNVTIKANIRSKIPLKAIFSPSHEVKVNKESDTKASVIFQGTNIHPNRDFTLYISRSEQDVGLTLIPYRKDNDAGYFLLTLTPKVEQDASQKYPKDVVFVFDTSYSMIAEGKIEQAKEALKYCLSSLRPEDRFNIVAFATKVTMYQKKESLLYATKENIASAIEFVNTKLIATGGTNIYGALSTALTLAPKDTKRPFMLIFLTDGEPTIRPTEPQTIIDSVKQANVPNLRLFCFGVGARLNTKLLDSLSEENRGDREYVDMKENIEIKVSRLFDKISSPVLHDIFIEFPKLEKLQITEVYPKTFGDLFKNGQLTIVGRYVGHGGQSIEVSGFVGDKEQTFGYEVNFPESDTDNNQIPRLWAVRKVGFLLEQIRLEGETKELREQVIELAEEFGIVTPYTSYLVLEDDPRIGEIQRRQDEARHIKADIPVTKGNSSFSRNDAAPSPAPMQAASKAMAETSGESAVETSRMVAKMKRAEIADVDQERDVKAQDNIRKIDEKTFYLKEGVWCDSTYDGKATKTRVRYMSKEYFELLQKKPAIGKFLALGAKLIVVLDKNVYEIYP